MLNNIYISSGSFKRNRLNEILAICNENSISNIELGANIEFAEDNIEAIYRNTSTAKFLFHNYFPRPKEDFVLNLASNDKDIFRRSFDHCKQAINISARLKAPFFSIHAGFAFHSQPKDLGHSQTNLPKIPKEEAYKIFIKAVTELAHYCAERDVKLAVENNVVADFNLINGKNEILFLAEPQETLNFYKSVGSDNLYFLIDLGHLKVTSRTLKFNSEEYVSQLSQHIIAFHVSDNNGELDQHLSFNENAWFKGIIRKEASKFFIIETRNLEINEIKKTYLSLKKMIS